MPAIFLNAQSVGIILFVLHRRVIAPFAISTRQRDNHSVVLFSHGRSS